MTAWLSVIASLVSLIVGWFLNEIAKKSQMSRERRAHIGCALSNLLELHHQMRAIENIIEYFYKQFSLPTDSQPLFRAVLEQILPQEDGFITRYEAAIEQLSESDPVTAFELRTKGQISILQKKIRTLGAAHGASVTDTTTVENLLRGKLLPALEKGIMALADLYGGETKSRVEKILSAPFELPEEMNDFIQNIKEQLTEQNSGLPPAL
ncbi:MAG: hypothetical protein WC208_08980 [Gallionella sp.]